MIDITVDVDDGTIGVDMKTFYIHYPDRVVDVIKEIVDKAKYSGESITLFKQDKTGKYFVHEW